MTTSRITPTPRTAYVLVTAPLVLALALLSLGAAACTASPTTCGSRGIEARGNGSTAFGGVWLSNGSGPFTGDDARLITVSPNSDGFRDRVQIHLTLRRSAIVQPVLAWGKPEAGRLYDQALPLTAGCRTISWTLPPATKPRTYRIELLAWDRTGRASSWGQARGERAIVRVQGIDAGFTRDSYRAGDHASIVVSTDAPRFALQLYRSGSERTPTSSNEELKGFPVGLPAQVDWHAWRSRPHVITIRVPNAPSGFYFAQLTAPDGRVGYAPLVLSPEHSGESRVAVVLPTFTWQAYNLRDENGDGVGDSWYATYDHPTVRLGRPYLDRGVPPHFRRYDLPFLHWLAWTGKKVDYLSDSDLDRIASGDDLARDYDLVVFPGHHEYVTRHEYDIVTRYRDLGGNLAFLFADNFFRRVDVRGGRMHLIGLWRDLGRPEAALIGDQYRANEEGGKRAPWIVRGAAEEPWLFAGTGLKNGSTFGSGGIEIDARASSSPSGTHVVAEIPDLYGHGFTAEMTYYETRAGARVFAAGAFGFTEATYDPPASTMLANLWQRLSTP